MAKTVQVIFVKTSGVGFLLEEKDLDAFNKLYKEAVDAYKKAKGFLDKIGGKMVKCQFQPINPEVLKPVDLKADFCEVVLVQDNGTFISYKGDAFKGYVEPYFKGLIILGKKQKITYRLIKIQTK